MNLHRLIVSNAHPTALLVWCCVCAPPSSLAQDFQERAEAYMDAAVDTWEFTGTVLVAEHGAILYQQAKGFAVREFQVPVQIDTKFRIGSLTKQFVAALVLQLQERGLLKIGDPVSRFLPDFPGGDSITIHQLLTHTSGVVNYTNADIIPPDHLLGLPLSIDSLYALIKTRPLDFRPGTLHSYSNGGYLLLGLIIERVSGRSFAEVLRENILLPAGMTMSGFEAPNDIIEGRALGYRRIDGEWKNFYYTQIGWAFSAGAMYSTVHDLQRWNEALFGGRILQQASMTAMTSPQVPTGEQAGYGYGFELDRYKGYARIGHGGEIVPFLSYAQYFPEREVYIVVLTNTDNVGAYRIGCDLAALFFDQPNQMPRTYQECSLDREQLERFCVGFNIDGRRMDLILRDGKLFRVFADAPSNQLQLLPASASVLFYPDRDAQWEFVRNEEGRLVKIVYWFDGERSQEIHDFIEE